tara:strand:- start:4435 stop:6231 length:1797 start_codon:yes stop_codon:yes gene_type:complete
MTVYNRKMFRKKGGGVNGIMASGPELIKAQQGVFANIGLGDPRGFDDTVKTRAPARMSQFPTELERLNTSYIPPSPGFGQTILKSLGMQPFMSIYESRVDSLEDEKQRVKNEIARAKNRKGESSLKQRVAATQGVDVFETTPVGAGSMTEGDASLKVPGTDLSFKDVAVRFKQQNKPFVEFLKSVPGLIDKSNQYVQGLASDLIANPTFQQFMSPKPGDEDQVEEEKAFTGETSENFLISGGKKFLNVLEAGVEKFKKAKKDYDDKVAQIDDERVFIGESSISRLSDLEREKNQKASITKKLTAVGNDAYNQKIESEDQGEVDLVTNKTKTNNIKKSQKAKEDGLNATVNNHNLSTNLLNENEKSLTSANLGKVLGYEQFENLSLDDRKNLYSSILESTVGDKADIKTDKDFNIIMTGLLIAAGDSPDALTNITRGLAQGFKMFGDALSEDRKEKREIQLTATKLAIQAEESAKERVFKAQENKLNRVTTTINKLIDQAGESNAKFGQSLTNTVAANVSDYMSETEYANFIKASEPEKTQIITNKVNSLYEASPFKDQAKNFDILSILKGSAEGKIPKNIVKENKNKITFVPGSLIIK